MIPDKSINLDKGKVLLILVDGEGITVSHLVNSVLKNNKVIKQIMESIEHDKEGGVYAVPSKKNMLRENKGNK